MSNTNNLLQIDRILEARVKLYYDLHLPRERSPAPLLIALHGYGASKRQIMREALRMVPDDFAVAALQGLHQHMREPKEPGGPLRFGFGWLTNFRSEESVAVHHQGLLDLIALLTSEGIADPSLIFLLGFSQSCALNYRFAFTHGQNLRGVVGICGGLPGDWETSAVYQPIKARVLHLAGARDEFYPPERVSDFVHKLQARATTVTFKTYDAEHEIIPEMRQDVRNWLLEHSVNQ